MAQQTELEVAPRVVMGKATKRLRKEGIIPGNITGHNQDPVAVQVSEMMFDRLRRSGGLRGVLSLRLPDGTQTALVRRVQRNPGSGKIVHIDFFRVSLSERVTMRVPLHFVGESSAVKNEGGVLLHLEETLEVECMASDIVDALEVDIAPLSEIDATLYAQDVNLPANYTLIADPEQPIAKVAATRAEVAAEEAAVETTQETPAPAAESES